jgi:AraC-like DNA-binding protein
VKSSARQTHVLDINPRTDYLYPIQPYPWTHFGFPSKRFINLVAFYHETPKDIDYMKKAVYPAANAAVVCRLTGRNPESFLVGAPTFPKQPGYIESDSGYFVALFWIGMGARLFPIPSSEIVDSYIPLKEIFSGTAQRLTDHMVSAKTFDQRVSAFERFLSEIANDIRQIPTQHQALMNRMHRVSTAKFDFVDQKEIQAEFSDRHVRRLIAKYTGLSPKLFMRIIRYQTTLHSIIASPNESMAGLAAEQGYFDQSHFIKEFKRFQGMTPNSFLRRIICEGDGDSRNTGGRQCRPHQRNNDLPWMT